MVNRYDQTKKKKNKSFRKKVREGYQISFEEEKEKRQKILGTDIKTCWRRKKKNISIIVIEIRIFLKNENKKS